MQTTLMKEITTSQNISKVIDLVYSHHGDTIASQVLIQVIGNCKVSVSGKICDDVENTSPLMVVDISSLEGVSEITSPGIYTLPTDGLGSITLSISSVTGTATVIVKGLL